MPDSRTDDRSPSPASPKDNVLYLDSSSGSKNETKPPLVDPFAADGGATIKSGGMPLTAWQASAAELAKLLVGKQLGSFFIEEALGTGGMAAVFKANDPLLDRRVALKILPPVLATQPEQVQRFEREARVSAQLDHDHIARVHQYGQDQGLHYIAYEYVEGTNLRDLMQQAGGKLTIADAVKYLSQAASGLAHTAARGVIHRDIKPSNLVINTQGKLKLVDLGLARNQLSEDSAALTQSGATLGTFDYLSPEQAIDPRRADVRSDIYSLGCTFYHAVTGVPPVPEGTAARKLQSHQMELPADPRTLNPEVPAGLVQILSKMLAKKPEDRYQQADELVRDLQQLQSPSTVILLQKKPINDENALPWYLPVLGILFLALGVISWDIFSGSAPRATDRNSIIAKYQSPIKVEPSTVASSSNTTSSDAPLRLEIESVEDLIAALKRPQGGTIYLKNAQYEVRATAPLLIAAGDWTIRPLGTASVTLRLADKADASLLEVVTGALHLVDLKLEISGQDATGIAIHPPAQLTCERCEFIRLSGSSSILRSTTPASFVKVVKGIDSTQAASLEFKGVLWNPSSGIGTTLEAPAYFLMEECCVGPQYQFVVMPALAQSNQKRLVSIRQSAISMPSDACFKVAGKMPIHLELERTLFSKLTGSSADDPIWLVMEENTPVDLQSTETLFHRVNTYAAWQRPTATRDVIAREWRQIRTALSRCRDEGTAFTTRSPWLEMRPWQRYLETRNVTALALKADYSTTGPTALLGQKLQLANAIAKESSETSTKKTRTLIVDGRGEEQGAYSTLNSAIGTITDEEETIIEVHLHGTVAVKPTELGNSKIILKAGEGFQPELAFHRDTVAGPDGETQLFRLHDGELSIENIKVRMEPLRDTAKALSLLNITGMGKCRLKDAIITLKGNSELTTTVYTISEPAGNMPGSNKTLRAGAARLDCTDSLVRGNGQLLHVQTSRPFQLQLLQTGIALDGTLLLVEGNRGDMSMPNEPAQVQLDRCTCYGSRGILQLRATTAMPQLGALRCVINQSILASSEMQPLVRIETQQSEGELKRKLLWQGKRNIYLSASGTMLATQQLGEATATLYDANLWGDTWGSDDEQAQIVKQVPLQGLLRQTPMAEWESTDFGLREAANLNVREMGLPMESMPRNQSP